MTLPPCYQPDDEPANPPRRSFMIGSAAATAGLIVTPLLGEAARQNAAATQQADPNAIPVSLDVNGSVHTLKLDPRTTLLDALRQQREWVVSKIQGIERQERQLRAIRDRVALSA